MKHFFFLLTAGCLFCPITNYGSETAHARLYCASLQFQEARANDSYGFQMKVDLTTLPSGINGELAPYFLDTSYTHSAYVQVYSEAYSETDTGDIWLDVPDGGDANGDGYPDFFEVSQGVANLTSSGFIETYGLYYSGYSFTATWNRAAGSSTGTCSYQLYDPSNPYYLITFTHSFTLLEYTGPLTYTPGSNTVSGVVSLTQTGNSASTLQGPIIFDKSATDPFNTLTNRAGVWTNAAMQQFTFYSDLILRDTTEQTNYFSYYYFEFTDGDPSTASPDYQLWVLSIDDTNDANANGIPDFSDNPATVTPPRAPRLSLALGSTNLLLTVSGDIGHTNQIEQASSLTSTWQTTQTFVPTNNPQVVSLPLPAGSPKFWRVVAY